MNQSNADAEQLSFEDSLTSFMQYENFDKIPGAVFRRARGIMEKQRIKLDVACSKIAQAILEDQIERGSPSESDIHDLRERVSQRILEARPSQPGFQQSVVRLVRPNEVLDWLKKTS